MGQALVVATVCLLAHECSMTAAALLRCVWFAAITQLVKGGSPRGDRRRHTVAATLQQRPLRLLPLLLAPLQLLPSPPKSRLQVVAAAAAGTGTTTLITGLAGRVICPHHLCGGCGQKAAAPLAVAAAALQAVLLAALVPSLAVAWVYSPLLLTSSRTMTALAAPTVPAALRHDCLSLCHVLLPPC